MIAALIDMVSMGIGASVSSLANVLAPITGAALVGVVSYLLQGDWRMGALSFFCAALQFTAMLVAARHLRVQAARDSGLLS